MAVLVNNSINSLSVADRASGDPSKGGDPNYPNPQAPTHFRICSPERPPEFTRETENHLNIGRIWYNSLQVSVQKRYSCGLTFQRITHSNNIQEVSYVNPDGCCPDAPS